jgi:hypothetical protein
MEFDNEIQMWLDAGAITRAQAIKFQLNAEKIAELKKQIRETRPWQWIEPPLGLED